MNVLVVDDSAAMRRILQKGLESRGWTVSVADGGESALVKLAEMAACDLLVTDWHMPGMDGLELVRAVRRDARYVRLPILMVTSDAVLDSVEKALEAGANDFLMKPFTTEALVERASAVMELQHG